MADLFTPTNLDELAQTLYSLSSLKRATSDDKDINKAVDNLAALFLERAAKKLQEPTKPSFPQEVVDLMNGGQGKITCIRRYRELTNAGLLEAKTALETYAHAYGYDWSGYGGGCVKKQTW